MAVRRPPTTETRLTPKLGTSSGMNPEEDFKGPGLGDLLGLEAEVPRGSTRPTGGLLPKKPVTRSPLGIEAGQSAGGGLNITGSIPLGGPISGRAGVNIGKDGSIKGGQVGLGLGIGPIGASIDVGTDQDEEGRGGCYRYVTVSIGFFSHTYGKNVCEPKPPTPSPMSTPTPSPGGGSYNPKASPGSIPLGGYACSGGSWKQYESGYYFNSNTGEVNYRKECYAEQIIELLGMQNLLNSTWNSTFHQAPGEVGSVDSGAEQGIANYYWGEGNWTTEEATFEGSFRWTGRWRYEGDNGNIILSRVGKYDANGNFLGIIKADWTYKKTKYLVDPSKFTGAEHGAAFLGIGRDYEYKIVELIPPPECPGGAKPTSPPSASTPVSSSPVPNPPIRKKMDDQCCKAILLMLQMQHKHFGISPIPGLEPLNKLAGVTLKGENFQGEQMAFPFEVPKVWLDPVAKQEEKILIKNISELLFVMGSQAERLERVLGTKEFIKDSEGKLRQSEGNSGSWLTGKNPDFAYPDPDDFWFNTDDGIIKEKHLEIRNLSDAIRYVVEMGNRLERILPIAELKDSSIPKRWIYPGAKGQERVGNLIHLIELMVRSDDKHRGYWPVKVKVKDADPAIKGDQAVELEFHSQADVFRELFQFLIDMEGDGDMSSNFALRSAFQTCQMHQLTVQNNAMLDAIVEYLDFKVNKTTADVPMPFNPFAGMSPSLIDQALQKLGIIDGMPLNPSINSNKEADIEALAPNVLQNTIVKVDIVECDESKTLNESLLELLKHTSAASAAVSERVSESAIDRVIEGARLAQEVKSFLLRRDVAAALGIGDLDKWINSAELGYTDTPESESLRFPESDPTQPYGRPITENPKIREIDTKEPKAD